jgi:hypothetical protein
MKKWIFGGIGLSVLILVIVIYAFHGAILLRAGRYLAPSIDHTGNTADVVLVEGNEFIQRYTMTRGIDLFKSGDAKHLVILLTRINQDDRPFAINEDYLGLVRKNLQGLGLGEKDFEIILTPYEHPLTLSAAKAALDLLSKEGVTNIILLSNGFHTRRSYLTYQYVGEQYQIKIVPQACFENDQQIEKWWIRDKDARAYVSELSKLIYYIVRGYIPLKFSY